MRITCHFSNCTHSCCGFVKSLCVGSACQNLYVTICLKWNDTCLLYQVPESGVLEGVPKAWWAMPARTRFWKGLSNLVVLIAGGRSPCCLGFGKPPPKTCRRHAKSSVWRWIKVVRSTGCCRVTGGRTSTAWQDV